MEVLRALDECEFELRRCCSRGPGRLGCARRNSSGRFPGRDRVQSIQPGSLICFSISVHNSDGTVTHLHEKACGHVLTGVGDAPSEAPKSTRLYQNYPNPFNPTTEFRYKIRDAGYVSLKVVDVLGREVATLVNSEKQPGEYSVTWDAGSFASRVYFYRMATGSYVGIQKMILMK